MWTGIPRNQPHARRAGARFATTPLGNVTERLYRRERQTATGIHAGEEALNARWLPACRAGFRSADMPVRRRTTVLLPGGQQGPLFRQETEMRPRSLRVFELATDRLTGVRCRRGGLDPQEVPALTTGMDLLFASRTAAQLRRAMAVRTAPCVDLSFKHGGESWRRRVVRWLRSAVSRC